MKGREKVSVRWRVKTRVGSFACAVVLHSRAEEVDKRRNEKSMAARRVKKGRRGAQKSVCRFDGSYSSVNKYMSLPAEASMWLLSYRVRLGSALSRSRNE